MDLYYKTFLYIIMLIIKLIICTWHYYIWLKRLDCDSHWGGCLLLLFYIPEE